MPAPRSDGAPPVWKCTRPLVSTSPDRPPRAVRGRAGWLSPLRAEHLDLHAVDAADPTYHTGKCRPRTISGHVSPGAGMAPHPGDGGGPRQRATQRETQKETQKETLP